jgi:hypothetical protein
LLHVMGMMHQPDSKPEREKMRQRLRPKDWKMLWAAGTWAAEAYDRFNDERDDCTKVVLDPPR